MLEARDAFSLATPRTVGAAAPALTLTLLPPGDDDDLAELRLSGLASRECLSRLVRLDLESLPMDSVVGTDAHGIALKLAQRGDGYHLAVPRSYADSFVETLLHAGAAFGIEAVRSDRQSP
ncbi:hypothetical protein [Oryzibacter oryziterrae]|uniref:hypothetical protein n=1 Tax=Oryzibacter oryziterrae TaxID=2766474 RepID=UPI001F414F9A|nr:hypothetical protein [Oryzibacter oryziterrae]